MSAQMSIFRLLHWMSETMDLSLSERVLSVRNWAMGQIFFMVMFSDMVSEALKFLILKFLVLKKVLNFFAVSEMGMSFRKAWEVRVVFIFFSLATSQRPFMWSMSLWLIIRLFMVDMPRLSRKGFTIFLPMLEWVSEPESNRIVWPLGDWASIVWP